MIMIIIGTFFLIASFIFWNNTEGVVPRILRMMVCQIGMFVGLFCLNLDLEII